MGIGEGGEGGHRHHSACGSGRGALQLRAPGRGVMGCDVVGSHLTSSGKNIGGGERVTHTISPLLPCVTRYVWMPCCRSHLDTVLLGLLTAAPSPPPPCRATSSSHQLSGGSSPCLGTASSTSPSRATSRSQVRRSAWGAVGQVRWGRCGAASRSQVTGMAQRVAGSERTPPVTGRALVLFPRGKGREALTVEEGRRRGPV